MEQTEAVPPIRVFLLDDHEIVREGIRALLENEGMTVVGEAGSATEALDRIPDSEPDVAVLDVRLPDGDGVEVCREIRARCPDVACIMLTSYADDEAQLSAVMAGAAGYVVKQIRARDLVEGIQAVSEGASLMDHSTTQRLMVELRRNRAHGPAVGQLTQRESEILDLIAAGMTNRQIGSELFLAEKTIKNYVSNLLAKLGMARRTEAAAYAIRLQERRSQHPGS